MSRLVISAVASVCLLAVCAARADEILFKNGDRITGKIEKVVEGKMTIKTAVAGDVEVKLDDVKTFTTDEPIMIQLKDGTVLNQPVRAAGQEGQVELAPGGAVAPQAVSFEQVKAMNPPPVKWTGSLAVGALVTRGNSHTDNFSLTFDAVRRSEKDRISTNMGYLYGRDRDPDTGDDSTSTDNWWFAGKYDYFFTKKWYGYTNIRVERDRIADLDLRLTPGVGVGYQWVETESFNFNTEGGLTWVYEKFENEDATDHLAGRLAYHIDKKINDKVKVFHNLEYLPSLEEISDFNINADLGIRTDLSKKMFAEFKMQWNYDATPAEDKSKSDLRYILGVGWAF